MQGMREIRQESPTQLSLVIKLCSLALCFNLWIASLLTPNLVTTFACYSSFTWCLLLCNQICAMWEFLWVVCSVMVPRLALYGATTKPRAPVGAHTRLCYSTHTGIEVPSHDPLQELHQCVIFMWALPWLSLHNLSEDLYVGPDAMTFFWSRPKDNLWRIGHRHKH